MSVWKTLAAVGAVLAGVAAVVTIVEGTMNISGVISGDEPVVQGSPSAQPSTSGPATSDPVASSEAPLTAGPPSSPASSAGVPAPAVVYLDTLAPVESDFMSESVTWGAMTFPRSLVDPLSGCSAVGPVDWVIPADVRTFTAEIGVAADAVEPESRVSFLISLDGVQAMNRTLGVGQHEAVQVPLGTASRLQLEAIIDESRRNNCNAEADAVWGDARLGP